MAEDTSRDLPFELDDHGISTTPAYRGCRVLPFNLVLEGGSMRGLFTAGVLDLLMERGLVAQEVIGVSAGALNGFNYALGAYGRTAWINCRYCTDPRYLSMSSFAHTGNVFGREMSFDLIPNYYEPIDVESLLDSPIRLTAVSSDVSTGKADYRTFRPDDSASTISSYLCASSSMPFVSKFVQAEGKTLLDGGVCDSVPIRYSLNTGSAKHVVVLTRERGFVKTTSRLYSLANRFYPDYPNFVQALLERADDYNRSYRWVDELEEQGRVFVLRPQQPVTVSHTEHDPEKLIDLYAQGYGQALEHLPALERYLEA